MITLDGSTGEVFAGALPLVPPQVNDDFQQVVTWADEIRRLGVRANADTPEDATRAREFGAEGIGLCRSEHMFMAEERLPVVREMILAGSRRGARVGARPAGAHAAGRLRGDPPRDGRPRGHHPAARPAAARVPARRHRPGGRRRAPARRGRPRAGRRREAARPHPPAARVEPDARHARLPRRPAVPRDLRDAGACHRARHARGALHRRRPAARRS